MHQVVWMPDTGTVSCVAGYRIDATLDPATLKTVEMGQKRGFTFNA